MKLYPEDYDVEVVVMFTDLNGTAVTPTAVNAVLYDGDDQVVIDFGSLPFVLADGQKVITIPAAFNLLADGELSAGRVLRVELVTAAGSVRRSFSYLIEGEFRLALMVNSFMTIEAAEMLAHDMPSLTSYLNASDDQKSASLIEAFNRLTRIPMKFVKPDDPTDLSQILPEYIYGGYWSGYWPGHRFGPNEQLINVSDWPTVTAEIFLDYPAIFRKAVRAAQLTEANMMLSGATSTAMQKHRLGIVSETIGESSMTLKAGKVDYGVSSETLNQLRGFINFDMRIGRA